MSEPPPDPPETATAGWGAPPPIQAPTPAWVAPPTGPAVARPAMWSPAPPAPAWATPPPGPPTAPPGWGAPPPGWGGPPPPTGWGPPAPGWGAPGWSQPAPPAPGHDGVAVAALIVGLVSLVLFLAFIPAVIAIVLAVVAALRIKRSAGERTGRSLAAIGGGLGVLSLVLGGLVVALLVSSHIFEGHLTRYADLQVGDCFDQPGGIIHLYRRLPCTKAHDRQIVGVVLDPSSADAGYPGTTTLIGEGRTQCAAASSAFVLRPVGGGYRQTFYYPNRVSWDNGERRILCLVSSADGTKLPGASTPATADLSGRRTSADNGANIGS
jgi:hypothetical protein